jgi:hypothetical protein
MFRTVLLALAIALPAGAAMAQDIAPVISPGQAAEGIFHRSVAEGQATRIREGRSGSGGYAVRPGTTPGQAKACASRPNLRARYGADHPKILKLEQLCTQAGY